MDEFKITLPTVLQNRVDAIHANNNIKYRDKTDVSPYRIIQTNHIDDILPRECKDYNNVTIEEVIDNLIRISKLKKDSHFNLFIRRDNRMAVNVTFMETVKEAIVRITEACSRIEKDTLRLEGIAYNNYLELKERFKDK